MPGTPGDVVALVADEREIERDLMRVHAVLFEHAVGAAQLRGPLADGGHHLPHVLGHALGQILVGSDEAHVGAALAVGACEGRDHVVGFLAPHARHLVAEPLALVIEPALLGFLRFLGRGAVLFVLGIDGLAPIVGRSVETQDHVRRALAHGGQLAQGSCRPRLGGRRAAPCSCA
jgi:hypothetical protein